MTSLGAYELNVESRADQNGTLTRKPNHFEGRLAFSSAMESVCSARVQHKYEHSRRDNALRSALQRLICILLVEPCARSYRSRRQLNRLRLPSLRDPVGHTLGKALR